MLDHSLACAAVRPRRAHPPRNGSVAMFGPMLWITEFDDPIALERALRDFFQARRPVSVDPAGTGTTYPETSVLEIAQVAATLYNESRRYTDRRKVSATDAILFGGLAFLANELGRDDDYAGHRDAVERFAAYYQRLRTALDALPPTAIYADNVTAWREARRLALRLGVAKDHPIASRSLVGSVVRAAETLPDTLAKTAEVVSRAALAPVRALGGEVGGLFKSIAVPLAIGGGAVLGVVLLSRSSRQRERAS